MSRAAPRYLLAALITRHQRGHVDQAQAAKLLGIRKCDFAALSAFRSVEKLFWEHYLERFHASFPECDRRAVRREYLTTALTGARQYTDAQLVAPPNRELEIGAFA